MKTNINNAENTTFVLLLFLFACCYHTDQKINFTIYPGLNIISQFSVHSRYNTNNFQNNMNMDTTIIFHTGV